jgi:uncharacterized protein (DUF4415 family)
MANRISEARASRPDEENPEWSREDLKRALPASAVLPGLIGEAATRALLRSRGGRPVKADRKISQTLRLDPDVLDAYKQEGDGWQTRINQVLREHMPSTNK